MGDTDGRGETPAGTCPGRRSTDRTIGTIGRGSMPVRGLAEAGVGSGEGGRPAVAGPVISAAVPQTSPTAMAASSWRRVLVSTTGQAELPHRVRGAGLSRTADGWCFRLNL
jgi:hypothetical protein